MGITRRNFFKMAGMTAVAAIGAGLTGCGDGGYRRTDNRSALSYDEAREQLKAMAGNVDVTEAELVSDISVTPAATLAEELPDIDTVAVTVKGEADVVAEIFASGEKSGDGQDGWINEVARRFNSSGKTVNGKSAAVTIRKVSSGQGCDYIASGKYVPAGYTPSNAIWGQMLEASGAHVSTVSDRLVGNVAGILLSKDSKKAVEGKYKETTFENVIKAQCDGVISMGYTNPYTSATGMNLLMSMMEGFDPDDPTSDKAVNELQRFLDSNPPVVDTTQAMRTSANAGLIDCMAMEAQAYVNDASFNGYIFVPAGVRHDNPLFQTASATAEQAQVLSMFAEMCADGQSQKTADEYGFNQHDDYATDLEILDGNKLTFIQGCWKSNKDNSRPVVACFVADTSGSMEGDPMTSLRDTLINNAKYISATNYIGLVTYSDAVTVALPIEKFDAKRKAYFNGAVRQMSASGGTATYDALLVAANMVLDKSDEIGGKAKKMIFLLSDGEANMGYEFGSVADIIKPLGFNVHTIAFNKEADHDSLQRLADLNESTFTEATSEDINYKIRNIFNSQM